MEKLNKTKIYRAVIIILAFIVLCESIWIFRWTRNNQVVKDDSDQSVERELSYTFKKALSEGKIEVWFQPIVDPVTEKTNGAEALSRWKSDDGYISPGDFIPALEESGQIKELDRNAFTQACDFQRECMTEGKDLFPISVNLSTGSITDSVVSEYKDIYDSFGLPEKMVSIEITESADLDSDLLKETVSDFHNSGFLVEIDDFGSGYNSLSDLVDIHYDVLKIDKSLIDEVGNERGNVLISDIVKLAKDLNMGIIAEGVETKDQVEFLKELKCNGIQGYYYSKNLSRDDFIKYIDQ